MADFQDNTTNSQIDPNFFLPPNVVDLRYLNKDEGIDGEDKASDIEYTGEYSTELDSGPTVILYEEDTSPQALNTLPIPTDVTIVSQNVRVLAGGGYVVDVVINVADMLGVDNFDVQVAKQ